MQIINRFILIATVFSVCNLPASAGWYSFKSNCGGDDGGSTNAVELRPWYKHVYAKLEETEEFNRVEKQFLSKLKPWQNVVCTFAVRPNGQVAELKISESSGFAKLDNLILHSVENAAPYPIPPNNLPCQRGLTLELWKAQGVVPPKTDKVIALLHEFRLVSERDATE
jgi:TonB family protein